MDQMEIDVEEVGLAGGGVDDVLVPDLLGQGGGVAHGHLSKLRPTVNRERPARSVDLT